jgi:hypothetical protein
MHLSTCTHNLLSAGDQKYNSALGCVWLLLREEHTLQVSQYSVEENIWIMEQQEDEERCIMRSFKTLVFAK